MAKKIENDVVETWKASPDTETDEEKSSGPEVIVNVVFEGGIKVINSLNKVNSKGSKSDHLYILTDNAVIKSFGGNAKDGAAGFTHEGSNLIILSRTDGLYSRTAAHETGHAGGLNDNPNGYLMDNGASAPSQQEKRGFYNNNFQTNMGYQGKLNKYIRKRKKHTDEKK